MIICFLEEFIMESLLLISQIKVHIKFFQSVFNKFPFRFLITELTGMRLHNEQTDGAEFPPQ